MQLTDQQFLTVLEIAELLRISRTHAYALVRRGDIPSIRAGGAYRIPRDQFERWIAGQHHAAA